MKISSDGPRRTRSATLQGDGLGLALLLCGLLGVAEPARAADSLSVLESP